MGLLLLGVILLVIGFVTSIYLLWILGIVCLIIGLVLFIAGGSRRPGVWY